MSNKVTFGLTNVHYALATQAEDGSWTFATPKRLEGAQEITTEAIGGSTQVYADDKVIATLVSNSGTNVTLKFTEIDDVFKKDIFGVLEDTNGNLVEVVNGETKTFALGYEIQGDIKARRIWYLTWKKHLNLVIRIIAFIHHYLQLLTIVMCSQQNYLAILKN
jgi:phi13 family phage major tail protein